MAELFQLAGQHQNGLRIFDPTESKTVTITSKTLSPPNSLVLIEGLNGGEVPRDMAGSLIASTRSCIAVGCKSEADGETHLTLGRAHEVDPAGPPAFEGTLETPDRRVVVRTVSGEALLEHPVRGARTLIRVWVNDPEEPDDIRIGISEVTQKLL